MGKIEIIKITNEQDKRKHIYSFCYLDGNIYLDSYQELGSTAPNSRKWKLQKKYDRIFKRENTINDIEVPLTDEIKELALKKFIDGIKVQLWRER